MFWLLLSAMLTWQAAQTQQAGVGVVQGTVTRVGTTEPLAGVQVDLLPGNYPSLPVGVFAQPISGPTATSDGTGHFEIRNVPAGRHTIRIQSNGFSGAPTNVTTLTLAAGGTVDLNLSAIPGAILRGHVTDSNGQFLSNVNVQAFLIYYQNGMASLQPAVSKMTDDRGQFRLFGIPPGEYYVGVTPRPTAPNAPAGVRDMRTFHPSSTNAATARRLVLKGGEEITNIDIGMQSAMHVRVSGRVISEVAPPAPVTGAPGVFAVIANTQNNSASLNLILRDVTMPGEYAARAAAVLLNASPGEFQISNVTPGSYDLFASVAGAQAIAYGRVQIEIADRDVTGVSIVMRQGVDVSGTVTIDGVPNTPVPMNLVPVDSFARIGVAYATGGGRGGAGAPPGTFTFRSVLEGRFRLLFPSGSGQYVDDILQNGRSVYDSGIEITSRPPDPLQVILKSNGGTVEGSVVDGSNKPFAGATVALVPNTRRENPGRFRSSPSDATGKFSLRGVPPGEYKLFAWPVPIHGSFHSPAFLAQYEEFGKPITIGPNGRVPVTLSVITGR